jgi:hypothetical protein
MPRYFAGLLLALAGRLAAQSPGEPDPRLVMVGGEFRQIKIGEGSGQTTIRQWAIPAGASITAGRVSFDLGAAYAESRLTIGTAERTVSGLTDTQLRGSYTFGRDAVVASVVLNLPTGRANAPPTDFAVNGAISSSFFGFPVNTYGSGFSATAGLAAAIPAGEWSLGIAGSMRVSAKFTPYSDPTGSLTYQPGLEGRIRAGVDRIVGQSRLTAGFTWSTFGTDQLTAGPAVAGLYQPGPRWLAEGQAVVPVGGRARLALQAWHYQRNAGDSVGVTVPNSERLSSIGAVLRAPLAGSFGFRLGIDGRLWHQGQDDGKLGGALFGLGIPLGSRVTLSPEVRYDVGQLEPTGGSLKLRGLGGSVFLRSSF